MAKGVNLTKIMNKLNENQHWVSRVLLERFRIPGNPLQCYQIESGEWIPKSVDRACSWPGYTQLLQSEHAPDNSLEAEFQKVETHLPKMFKALEEAAHDPQYMVPPAIYEICCKYFACLNLIALVAKPGAVVSFVMLINHELAKGHNNFLRELNIPEKVIDNWRKKCAIGRKVIIESENLLQSLFRFQFNRSYALDCEMFRISNWRVCNSPIELPISDIGLASIHLEAYKAKYRILPIGPHLALTSICHFDLTKNTAQSIIRRFDLNIEEAEYLFDVVCSSAVSEIICSRVNPDVPVSLNRAKAKGIYFHKLVNPKAATVAGLNEADTELRYKVVSVDEFKQYVHSYVSPSARPGTVVENA
jgi:hypothetical protein